MFTVFIMAYSFCTSTSKSKQVFCTLYRNVLSYSSHMVSQNSAATFFVFINNTVTVILSVSYKFINCMNMY